MNLEDLLAALDVGHVDDDAAVEPAGPEKRAVEDVGPVGGGDEDDAFVRVEPVHLDQELVERLLALVVPAAETGAALAADGVDLVDEDQAGRVLFPLVEKVRTLEAPTPTNISTKSEPLIEKKGTSASPATARASRVSRFPAPRRGGRPWDAAAQLLEAAGVLEEVDDFLELFLGFIDTGDVLESGLFLGAGEQLGPAFTEGQGLLPPACIWRMKRPRRG